MPKAIERCFTKITIGRADMHEFIKKMPEDEDRCLIVNYMRTLEG